MRSARTAKHIIIGLLLLGILLVGGWYFLYPYSLGSRISATPFSLSQHYGRDCHRKRHRRHSDL